MVRKIVLLVIVIGVVGALLIQLVPYGRAHANPPVAAEPTWDSPQTEVFFRRVCADCHSNETFWPWYSNVAPMSWLVQNHVDEGRAVFNVSRWGQGENESEDAAELYQRGEMPPANYLWLHPEARLTATEREQFIQGLVATFGGEGGGRGEGRERGDD